jgi:hypothetical protein
MLWAESFSHTRHNEASWNMMNFYANYSHCRDMLTYYTSENKQAIPFQRVLILQLTKEYKSNLASMIGLIFTIQKLTLMYIWLNCSISSVLYRI